MTPSLSLNEKLIAKDQSPLCDGFAEKDDLIFSYPKKFMEKAHAEIVANTLQRGMNYLKYITDLNPTKDLNSRVIIRWLKDRNLEGKSTWKSKEDTNRNIIGHRINLSWDYMIKPCQPLDVCTHELVHPFYRVSPLHEINEFWGEGFCDFLRGPLKNLLGLDGNEYWREKVNQARDNKQDRGGNAAGQLVIKLCDWHGVANEMDQLIDNQEAIREFVNYLFYRYSDFPMSEEFQPTKWITEKERKHNKGPFRDSSV